MASTNFSLNDYLIIDTTGSIGIGTTTPGARLFVTSSSTATSQPGVVFKAGTANQLGGVGLFDVQNSTGTSLIFVSGSGRIGVGTTSPSSKLHVAAGDIRFDSTYGIIGATNTDGYVLRANGTRYVPAQLGYSDISGTPTIGDATLTVGVSGTGLSISATPTFTANATSNKTITITSNATSSNTVSTLVARDANGDFNAGRINVIIDSSDTRAVTTTPETLSRAGVVFDFKQNTSNALSDGGTYHGLMTFRQYGSTTDWSGGRSHQLGFTDNDNVWHRSGTSTTWGTWYKFYHTGNLTNPTTGTGTTSYVARFTGTSTLGNSIMQDDGTRVGVGTTGTSTRMTVYGTSTGTDTTLLVRHQVANGSNLPVLDVQNSSSTSLLFVSGSGRVGINSSAPTAELTVRYATANSSTTSPALLIDNPSGGAQTALTLAINGVEKSRLRVDNSGNLVINAPGVFYFGYDNSHSGFRFYNGTGSRQVDIDTSGNVGIGTATMSNKLSIYGTAQDQVYIRGGSTNRAGIRIDNTAGYQSQILLADNNTDKWQIGKQTDNTFFLYDATAAVNIIQGTYRATGRSDIGLVPYQNGRVGIGTDPAELGKLEIYATGSLQGIYQSDGTRWLRILAGTSTSGAYNNIVSANDYALIFSGSKATNTPCLVLTPWDSAGATSGLKIDPSGNVGIGTATMTRKLVVHGSDALINGIAVGTGNNSSDTYNTAVGDSANGALTTGSGNTAVGRAALITVSTGNNNVAVGSSALQSQTASNATAVGTSALWQSTATGNTAVGYNALSSITANSGSVAVGYEALKNATGSRNTALGWLAGNLVSTGNNNIAIGSEALRSVTTTNSNIAIGYKALELSTGGSNTVIGAAAGFSLTTGGANVALGALAIAASSAMSGSTAIGTAALSNATGDGNTGLGYSAGSAITSGVGNVVLGSFTGNAGGLDIRTGNNNIVLSDGQGNVRVHIDYTGAVGIGTTTAFGGYMLHLYSGSNNNTNILLQSDLDKSSGLYMQAGTGIGHFYRATGSGNYKFGTMTSVALDIQTNNTTAVNIDTSQNVGIGTDNTGGEALRVYRSSGATTGLYSNTGNATIIASGYNSTTAVTAALEVSSTVATLGTSTNHPLRLLTNSTEAMRINTSQNVGIGTTSPGSKLHVYSAGPTELQIESTTTTERSTVKFITNGNDWEIGARGSSGNPNNSFYVYDNAASAYRAVINSSGYVGIGTTNPSALLHVHGETWIYNSPYGGYSHLSYGTTGDNYISSGNDGTFVGATYIRGKSPGNASTDIAVFTVSGTAPRVAIGAAAATYYFRLGADSAAKPTTNTWTVASDQRLKENIKTISDPLAKILKLRGVEFDWKPGLLGVDVVHDGGFIAQELEVDFPHWVREAEPDEAEKVYIPNGMKKDFAMRNDFYALTVESFRELKNENDTLRSEVQSLKDQISSILAMLSDK
jgi:hypothetical protein